MRVAREWFEREPYSSCRVQPKNAGMVTIKQEEASALAVRLYGVMQLCYMNQHPSRDEDVARQVLTEAIEKLGRADLVDGTHHMKGH